MDRSIDKHRFKVFALAVAVFFLLFLGMESLALARAGGGRSSGTSGSRSSGSYRSSTPSGSYQRTQPMTPTSPTQSVQKPSMGRSFLAGLGGGMLGGMLGSMLFGGRGYAGGPGGWGGGGFGFGDLILLIIVAAIVYFVWRHFRQKRQAAMEFSSVGETFGTGYAPQGYSQPLPGPVYEPPSGQQDVVYNGLRNISATDPSFDEARFKESVEDMFFKIQSGWTKRDLSTIRHLFSSQMLTTFQEDVNRYVANKQINRLENIAVRQVEIVDAVQDQGEEYITVKFLASLLDYVVDDTSNQVISGSTTDPVKFLEYWTFTRRVGDRNWVLAGITQEGDY